ncbi:MAG: hypothetical protein IT436_06820 [Phycisphaerales bacterium]|nr:hypothetical protein [Phycisphaerales bacterium]
MNPRTGLIAFTASVGLTIGLAAAQPADQPPPPPPAPGAAAEHHPADPAVVRERLQKRIEEMRRQLEKTEAALKSLDEGAPADQVLSELGGPPAHDGPPGREGGPGRDGPMSRQEREHIRDFIKDNLPLTWERLQLAERGSPQRAERLLGMMRPRLAELMDLKRRDKALFELKLEDTRSFMMALESAREVRELRAKGGAEQEIAAAEAKVRELVAASVDAQLRFKARELESLGGRIEELRKELDGLKADRDKIIDQRTKRLTSGREGDERPGGGERFRGGRPQRPEPK